MGPDKNATSNLEGDDSNEWTLFDFGIKELRDYTEIDVLGPNGVYVKLSCRPNTTLRMLKDDALFELKKCAHFYQKFCFIANYMFYLSFCSARKKKYFSLKRRVQEICIYHLCFVVVVFDS